MSDVAGFADAIAQPHLGFAARPSIADLGPTPAQTFVDGLHAGRLTPGYRGVGGQDMDPVALFQDRGPQLWPAWRPQDLVDSAPGEGVSMFDAPARVPASHPLASSGVSGAVTPPAPGAPRRRPGMQAATAAIDHAFVSPAHRGTGLMDVGGFVRDVRNYLDAPLHERAEDASPLWRSLQLSLAGIGGDLRGGLARPTMMRLPDPGQELVRAALDLAAASDEGPTQGTPGYFGPGKVSIDVARRFVRSPQGRRMTESLLGGGPMVHTEAPPRGTLWAAQLAAQAPRGAVPVAGAGAPADVVAGFDYQLLNAMDQWEAAFPGRAPYSTPVGAGAGNEKPDFKDTAPEIPRWDLQAMASAASGGGGSGTAGGGPVDVKAAQILQEMGLLGSGGVADFRRGMAAAGGEDGGWGFAEGLLEQGAEPALNMALIAPVIQVVQEFSRPLLKELPDGAPGAGISAAEKGIEEADSEKLEYVAQQILERLRMMIETEKDRRGY